MAILLFDHLTAEVIKENVVTRLKSQWVSY